VLLAVVGSTVLPATSPRGARSLRGVTGDEPATSTSSRATAFERSAARVTRSMFETRKFEVMYY